MKKFIKSGLLTASLTFSSVYSSQASAIAGAALSPVSGPLIATGVCYIVFSEAVGVIGSLAGVVVGGIGGGIVGGALGTPSAHPLEGAAVGAATGAYTLGLGGAIVGTVWSVYNGVVLMEGENSQDFKFGALDYDYAENQLGINTEQIEAFNDNIDYLNLIKEQVASELRQIEDPSPEDSARAWESVKADIDDLGIELETVARVLLPVANK
ncbi:MAG: hypothetical protein HRU09_18555 [Oligoflexales bacterium]|nr:hypothetical protein [Oligoflexales bacterium]